ncbi:MAG TPA: serine hydrolase domain-containing protein, partial [Ruania sp.]|nr:serine hydrolase domain-containing protein [Ruania sp.]
MRFTVTLLAALALFVTGLPGAAAATGGDRPSFDEIDSFVSDYLHRHGLAGASISVVKDGRILHTAGYGDTGEKRATSDTPMVLGSVSKSITAFAVLQLVDAGKVALDDPVVEHLPEFELDDPRTSQITVRQLLSQTSGLPNPTIVPPAADLTQAVARLGDWQLGADPGERHAYSNANFWLAARLVEVLSGSDFATYLDRNVFEPLGMAATRAVQDLGADDPGLQHGHVTAYGMALPMPEMEQFVAGAGGVISTAEDMGRWLAMITDQGRTPAGERLLSAKLLKEAQNPQLGSAQYGLGWSISGPDVKPARVGHSGTSSSHSAQLDVVPGSGYGVVVLLNSFTPTYEHNYAIGEGVIDITEGDSASLGPPVSTLIDAGLGVFTLAIFALTVVGVRRARSWANKRSDWPGWRFALRLAPHLVFSILAALAFVVLPSLQNNTATPMAVFGFWPAALALLLTLAVSGVALA